MVNVEIKAKSMQQQSLCIEQPLFLVFKAILMVNA
jgi:hypothetical protein